MSGAAITIATFTGLSLAVATVTTLVVREGDTRTRGPWLAFIAGLIALAVAS